MWSGTVAVYGQGADSGSLVAAVQWYCQSQYFRVIIKYDCGLGHIPRVMVAGSVPTGHTSDALAALARSVACARSSPGEPLVPLRATIFPPPLTMAAYWFEFPQPGELALVSSAA